MNVFLLSYKILALFLKPTWVSQNMCIYIYIYKKNYKQGKKLEPKRSLSQPVLAPLAQHADLT